MRTWILAPAVAAGLLSLTACDIEDLHGGSRFSQDFHYSYPLAANGRVSMNNFGTHPPFLFLATCRSRIFAL